MSRWGTRVDPAEVLEMIEMVLAGGGHIDGEDPMIRQIYGLRRGEWKTCSLAKADRILTRLGRPDLVCALTEIAD